MGVFIVDKLIQISASNIKEVYRGMSLLESRLNKPLEQTYLPGFPKWSGSWDKKTSVELPYPINDEQELSQILMELSQTSGAIKFEKVVRKENGGLELPKPPYKLKRKKIDQY